MRHVDVSKITLIFTFTLIVRKRNTSLGQKKVVSGKHFILYKGVKLQSASSLPSLRQTYQKAEWAVQTVETSRIPKKFSMLAE